MGIIHVLDEQLTNMIAAGEVVDRPVNIVKECVENALDAGADSIDIEVFQGGIDGVIVTDNGCGMSFDDARMAFERHATSKIQSEDELFSISTMGFRGEALPSIASVARVSMTTADVHGGTRIVFDYGELILHEHADVPQGTRIEVRGLFLHTPARFKYLKKPNYEFAVIADAVNKIALAHPEVRFTLRHDNRLIFQTTGKSNRLEILFQMFGRDAASKAEAFEASSPDFKISGYALQPSVNRASKSYIYLCLNGRTIRSWPIVNAIVEGYREFLPKERYPVCFLNIETDFQLVDVNVHPNKLEVRISKEEYLADLIKTTIQSLFEEKIQAPEIQNPAVHQKETYSMEPLPGTMVVQENRVRDYGKPAASAYPAGSGAPRMDRKPSPPFGYPAGAVPPRTDSKGQSAATAASREEAPQRSGTKASADAELAFLNSSFLNQAQKKLSDLTASDTPAQTAPVNPQNPAGEDLSPGQNPVSQTSVSAGEKTLLNSGEERAENASANRPEESAASGRPVQERTTPDYPQGTADPAEWAARQDARGIGYLDTLRIIGQLKDSYIVCEDDEGLVIIDQHAAQERANFEKIADSFEQPSPYMQPLILPISKTVPASLIAMVDTLNESVGRYGLHFDVLNRSLVLREIPGWMTNMNAEKFVDDLLVWFASHKDVNMQELRRHMIATIACHSSIRFNHRLSMEEMKKVIEDMKHCRQPYHCPHGRPTIIRLTLKQLAREFERA